MRLDKYLKASRLVKKRGLTREFSEMKRLEVNGKAAKPSKQIKPGDTIKIMFWRRHLTLKVNDCPRGNVSRNDALNLYEIIDEQVVEEW